MAVLTIYDILIVMSSKKRKFFLLAGLPGSGKTTTAIKLKEHEDCFVVSSDSIRLALNGGLYPRQEDYQLLEPIVWNLVNSAIIFLLASGKNVGIDATNLSKKLRKDWAEIARSVVPDIEVIVLWHTANYDSPQRWTRERGHTEEEYWEIRKRLADKVEIPSEDEGFTIEIVK